MRVVFAGTPEFAAAALAAIAQAGHSLALVLTQPDRPAGRGMHAQASAVKSLAQTLGAPIAQPPTLRLPESWLPIAQARADVLVVAAYGLILPQAVLDLPRLGAINIHASLLPRWRGAAPIQRALLAGDHQTGITIMRMDAGLDTGPMLMEASIEIGATDTAGNLHDRLAMLGARLVVDALARLEQGTLIDKPQPAEGVSYAAKIDKKEAEIDWTQSAEEIGRKVRAFNPFPGASGVLAGRTIKIWQASAQAEPTGSAGTVIAAHRDGIIVACGSGALCITQVQAAGGRRMAAGEFLAGRGLAVGDRFDESPDRKDLN